MDQIQQHEWENISWGALECKRCKIKQISDLITADRKYYNQFDTELLTMPPCIIRPVRSCNGEDCDFQNFDHLPHPTCTVCGKTQEK
jgi:hypothetical protein